MTGASQRLGESTPDSLANRKSGLAVARIERDAGPIYKLFATRRRLLQQRRRRCAEAGNLCVMGHTSELVPSAPLGGP
jgi:hypothetical protein